MKAGRFGRSVRWPVLAAVSTLCLAACGNPPYPGGSVESLFPQSERPVFSTAKVGVQRLPLENHFVLWEKPQLVIDAIQSLSCAS